MSKYNNCYKKAILSLLLTVILGTVILGTPTVGGTEAPGISVYVDPGVIWSPDMTPDTEFSVNICVDKLENLWAYQFWLSFNPDVIHGVSVENGPFLGKSTHPIKHPVEVVPGPGFDNEVGELKIFGAYISFSGDPPDDKYLADGGGVLATVTFKVVGYGCSGITLGAPETGLANKTAGNELRNIGTGEWEYCYGEIWVPYPGGGGEYKDYEPWLNSLGHGLFSNQPGPELYIRRRGSHGVSGVWPEWHVGVPCWTQTLYCRIMNYGFMGAWVEVEFVVRSEENGVKIMSEQLWIDPAAWVGDEIVPAEVTVSASFHPEIVGKYWIFGILYFKAGCMEEKAPYYLIEDALGGEGLSRDINVAFKVQEHI